MFDPFTILSVGSLVGGAISAWKAGDQADDYADAAGGLAKAQSQIARDQWSRYVKTFAPLENKVVSEVSKPLENQGYFAKMMAGVDKGYSDAKANVSRSMAGKFPSGSGMTDAKIQTIDLGRVRAKADATNTAESMRITKMMDAAALGRNLPGTALSGLSSASGTNQNLAGVYGNASDQGWGAVGNGAGNLTQLYMMNRMMGQEAYPYTQILDFSNSGSKQTDNKNYDVFNGGYGPVFN
jgi:hypothetical protein